MLAQRLITAAIGIPIIILVVWVGGVALAAVVGLAVFIASIEIAAGRHAARGAPALLAALAGALIPGAALAGPDWFTAAIVLAVLLPGLVFARGPEPARGVQSWLWGIATAMYFGVLAAHFILLRQLDDGRGLLFFALITVWVADTGAYFVGRPLGARAHKLAPHISPGKTIEGAGGQFLSGFVAVWVLDFAFGLGFSVVDRIVLGLLIPFVALVGDLAESALKRSLGVKDSSGLVPGHGGIADRLDSLLFAVPVVYYYVLAFV
jgi:phosphatidate cytidylyltransferase